MRHRHKDAELQDELQFHLEEEADDRRAQTNFTAIELMHQDHVSYSLMNLRVLDAGTSFINLDYFESMITD